MTKLQTVPTPALEFSVEAMINRRMAAAVSRAIRALDPGAFIQTEPDTRRLQVQPGTADVDDIIEMLASSGFTATLRPRPSDPAANLARSAAGEEPDRPSMTAAFLQARVQVHAPWLQAWVSRTPGAETTPAGPISGAAHPITSEPR